MRVLRDIGHNLSKEVGQADIKSGTVYKKEGKYYKVLNGDPISADEVGGRVVISFERLKK